MIYGPSPRERRVRSTSWAARPARGQARGAVPACESNALALRSAERYRAGDNPGSGFPSAPVVSLVSEAGYLLGRFVMVRAAPVQPRENTAGRASVSNCIRRAKGRVRLMVFAARADPLHEQTLLVRDQHE